MATTTSPVIEANSLSGLVDEELLALWNTTTNMSERDTILAEIQERGLFPSTFVNAWDQDTGAYPEYQDPLFLQKLLAKREFAESYQSTWIPTSDPCSDDANFESTPVQRFVANLLSPRSPYMSALLYHGVGVGKTCAAVQIAEAWLQAYPQEKVFLIAPPTIQEGFYRTMFDVKRVTLGQEEMVPNKASGCTGNTYMELTGTMLERDTEKISRKVSQAIRRRYNVFGYLSFAGYIEKLLDGIRPDVVGERREALERDILRHHFSGKLVIVDEAHNLRDVPGEIIGDDGPGGAKEKETVAAGKWLTPRLKKVLDSTEGMKLVLLTATPMYNNYREIIFILNLLLRNDKKATLSERDIFAPNGTFKPATSTNPGGAALLGRVANRYVSFMRGENPRNFPIRLFPKSVNTVMAASLPYPPLNPKGEIVPEDEKGFIKRLPLVAITLTGDSLAASEAFMEQLPSGTAELTSMDLEKLVQAGNFIAPATEATAEPTYENFRARMEIDGLEQILQKIGGSGGAEIQYKAREGQTAKWLAVAELGTYAPKFVYLINKIANCQGVAFIYSRFVAAGALPLALALEANGYTLAPGAGRKTRLLVNGIQDGKGRQCAFCNQRENGHSSDHPFSPAYYGILTGDEKLTPRNEDTILVERDKANKDGRNMKVIIGSQIASEGVDLRFVRETHILDSWYHLNKTEQIIGRSIRLCSHSLLPEEKRNTTIYLYTAFYPSDEPSSEHETADLYSYRRAFRKALEVGRVSRELKVHAIDCNLNHNAIVIEGQDPVRQIDSQGLDRPDVNINDMPGTAVCDWIEDCTYTCDPQIKITAESIAASDDSTYSQFSAKWREASLKAAIRALFKVQAFVSFERIWDDIFESVPPIARRELFSSIVDNKLFRVEHKGVMGYIRYCNGYYVFQPEAYADIHIPMSIRAASYPVRRDRFSPALLERGSAAATKTKPVIAEGAATAATGTPVVTTIATATGTPVVTATGTPVVTTKAATVPLSRTLDSEWNAIVRWVMSMRHGSSFPDIPEPMLIRLKILSGDDADLVNKYDQIIEMIHWFHDSYFNSVERIATVATVATGATTAKGAATTTATTTTTRPAVDTSSLPYFHTALLEYIWDNWFSFEEQKSLAYTSEEARPMIQEDSHNIGRIRVIRIFNPATGSIAHLCDGVECSKAILDALKANRDGSDPLRKLVLSKETTGGFYGFMATKKKSHTLVFKTKDQSKRGTGAECSIVSTTAEQYGMLLNLGNILKYMKKPDLDLREGVIMTGARKISNATRTCVIIELTLRLMDAERVDGKKWFYRPVASFMVGNRFG